MPVTIRLKLRFRDSRNAAACKRNPYRARTGPSCCNGHCPSNWKAAKAKAKYSYLGRPKGRGKK